MEKKLDRIRQEIARADRRRRKYFYPSETRYDPERLGKYNEATSIKRALVWALKQLED